MIHIISSTFIQQPINRVFDFISKPENDFQWQYETLSSSQTSEGVITVGSSFRSTGHLMGNRIQSTFEVTEYEPNKRYGFKSLSGPLQSVTSYSLDISKRYTQVKISTQANVVNKLEFNENILEKKMKRQIKENLAMLKNILESGSAI
ncbi:MAG TPA: SRPBCC family protein [Anaerolineales bacterium]|nr:SRPBCC family protein [Anaerolineales bacterium]